MALRLGCDVSPEKAAKLDMAASSTLVDAMCVSIEIVDTHWAEGLDTAPLAKLADLQAHGALAARRTARLTAQVCRVTVGKQAMDERRGTHALADPLFVLPAWLSHATRNGSTVPAGTVVTTGTWCGILQANAGDRVFAEFPGIGSASIQL